MEYSFLFPLMQKLWKSMKKCKTYSRKATGLFYFRTLCILPVFENETDAILDFTSGYNFDHVASAACDFASAYQISSKLDHL